MPAAPPNPYGKPDKTGWGVRIAFWLFVVAVIGGLGYAIHKMPRQKPLVCSSPLSPGLTNFGTCKEE